MCEEKKQNFAVLIIIIINGKIAIVREAYTELCIGVSLKVELEKTLKKIYIFRDQFKKK